MGFDPGRLLPPGQDPGGGLVCIFRGDGVPRQVTEDFISEGPSIRELNSPRPRRPGELLGILPWGPITSLLEADWVPGLCGEADWGAASSSLSKHRRQRRGSDLVAVLCLCTGLCTRSGGPTQGTGVGKHTGGKCRVAASGGGDAGAVRADSGSPGGSTPRRAGVGPGNGQSTWRGSYSGLPCGGRGGGRCCQAGAAFRVEL